jgi:prepilin-type N-terminal cleavage/methylation domain-containing protein
MTPIDMKKTRKHRDMHCRRAFTLVEMLVVVSILLIITVAVVAVAPRFTDDRKLSRAADQLAQILLTVKQRTKRDLVPTGVRLFPNAQGLVTELQYIQQPDDFSPVAISGSLPPTAGPNSPSMVTLGSAPNSAAIVGSLPAGTLWPPAGWVGNVLVASSVHPVTGLPTVDFTGGFGSQALWPVQPGDYLSVKGTAHLILEVAPNALVLAPVAPFQPNTSINPTSAGTNTITFVATANTAQIAAGMTITGPWANATTTTTVRSVNNTSPPGSQTLNLSTTAGSGGDWIGFLPAFSGQPTTYSVIRQPRVLQGETPLQLPAGICIDVNWPKYAGDLQDAILPLDPVTGSIDIMFSPQGNVLNVRGRDTMILWVRDSTKDVTYSPGGGWPPAGTPGEQFLILLQTHTGFITEHPVDVTPGYGPYTFTQDARSSGM